MIGQASLRGNDKVSYIRSNIGLVASFDLDVLVFKTATDRKLPEWSTITTPRKVNIEDWNDLATATGNEWRDLAERVPLNLEIRGIPSC